MILNFVPIAKMIEGVAACDVDQSDVGRQMTMNVRDVDLKTMDDGVIWLGGLPGGVIYHCDSVAVGRLF